MARTANTKIHSVILLTGISISCLGILLTTAGFRIKEELKGHSDYLNYQRHYDIPRNSQFWAGIPVVITGILLITGAFVREKIWLKSLCVVFLLVSMVVTLGVITEEAVNETVIHNLSKGSNCAGYQSYRSITDCAKAKSAAAWYQILLLTSDILLVLCNVALLAIFANWILFARKAQSPCYEQPWSGQAACQMITERGGIGLDNQAASTSAQPMTDSGGYDANALGTNVQMVQLPPGYSYK